MRGQARRHGNDQTVGILCVTALSPLAAILRACAMVTMLSIPTNMSTLGGQDRKETIP